MLTVSEPKIEVLILFIIAFKDYLGFIKKNKLLAACSLFLSMLPLMALFGGFA